MDFPRIVVLQTDHDSLSVCVALEKQLRHACAPFSFAPADTAVHAYWLEAEHGLWCATQLLVFPTCKYDMWSSHFWLTRAHFSVWVQPS